MVTFTEEIFNGKLHFLYSVKHVLARVDEGKKAYDIIQEVDIFRAIYWLKSAWKNVSADTIKRYFQKCSLKDVKVNPPEDPDIDEELKGSFAELSAGDDVSSKELILFDDEVVTSEKQFNFNPIAWIETA